MFTFDVLTLSADVLTVFIITGSLTSCDSFLAAFESKGLRHGAICPCASSPEAATASIRRYIISTYLSNNWLI